MTNFFKASLLSLVFVSASAHAATESITKLVCVSADVSTALAVTFTTQADGVTSGEASYLQYHMHSISPAQSHILETKISTPESQWLLRLTVNENVNGTGYSNAILSTTTISQDDQHGTASEELLTCSPMQ